MRQLLLLLLLLLTASGQTLFPTFSPTQVFLQFCPLLPGCCEDDCCGQGTYWHDDRCRLNATSAGWTGAESNSPTYKLGCHERTCCEETCCFNGTIYDTDLASCIPDPLHQTIFEQALNNETDTDTTTTTPSASPTVIASNSPSVAVLQSPPDVPEDCPICGPGEELTDPTFLLDLSDEGLPVPISCESMEVVGRLGFISEEECDYFSTLVEPCSCS